MNNANKNSRTAFLLFLICGLMFLAVWLGAINRDKQLDRRLEGMSKELSTLEQQIEKLEKRKTPKPQESDTG